MTRRLVLWAVLLTVIVSPLASADWQVAIISLSERSDLILKQTLEAATQYGRQFTLTEERAQHLATRAERGAQATADREIHALYASRDEKALAAYTVAGRADEETPSQISYTTVPYSPQLTRLLRSSSEGVRWYREREGLDGLLLIDVQSLDEFDRVICTAVEEEASILLDRLVTKGAWYELSDALDAVLLTYSGAHTTAALLITGGPLLLTISLDGVEQKTGERLFIRKSGEVSLTLSSPSHLAVERTIDLHSGTITTVEAVLEHQAERPVTFRSQSGRVDWFIDGQLRGCDLSLTIEKPQYPLSVLMVKEGFTDQEIGLVHDPGQEVLVTMEGRTALTASLLDREQKDFYKQLRKTILLFGAYVATIALGNTPALDHQFWQVGQVASGAVAMVNLVALMAQLAAYGR